MRRNRGWSWIALLAGFVMFFGGVPYAVSAPPGAAAPGATAAPGVRADNVAYLEKISFESLKGKERVTLMISRQSGVNIESAAGNAVLVKMENVFIPEELRRPLGEGKLGNIIRAVPVQKTANGAQWAVITIDLKEQVPYSVSQQGQNVLIDFNVTALESKSTSVTQAVPEPVKGTPGKGVIAPEGAAGKGGNAIGLADRRISLDFQDASIKAVLRLLAEEGGVSIVSGEDVKGNITVHMKKVPWNQALDTILEINGLAKKQMGDVISVVTLEKLKKDEADRKQGEEDRIKAELTAKKAEQERMEERGKLKQISIEAKIVEATDEFVRNIGVQWGGVSYGSPASGLGMAVIGGTNTSQSRGITWGYPDVVPYRTTAGAVIQSMSVNYPAAVASPSIGLILGSASGVLEAQLAALETNNQGKIISSPKVTTMDNVKATIKQGQEIPYITIDKDGNRSITFKEAVLKLEVKPKITPEGKISMEVKATNDQADYNRGAQLGGNPPIDKSEVESKLVVQNGDTLVIGGILKTEDTKGVSGIPWLSRIPVLGWLFKTESITKTRRQLMIFVTPKIMNEDAVGEKPPEQVKG